MSRQIGPALPPFAQGQSGIRSLRGAVRQIGEKVVDTSWSGVRSLSEILVAAGGGGGGGGDDPQAAAFWFDEATDPYWQSVSLLLNFDGADGSNTFNDSGPHNLTGEIEVRYDTAISTAQSKFGGSSGFLYNTSPYNKALILPSTPLLDPGTGDFTAECWVYPIVAQGRPSAPFRSPMYSPFENSGYFETRAGYGGPGNVGSLTLNQWSHVAVCREGSSLKLFLNGVLSHSSNIGTGVVYPLDVVGAGSIGDTSNGYLRSWCGYIDDFRYSKGIARYKGTGDFAPPASAFAAPTVGEVMLALDLQSTTTAYVGATTLSISATAYQSSISGYQWQKKLPGSSTWQTIVGENTNSLALSGLTDAGDAGTMFRCLVESPTSFVRSTETTITVDESGINGDNRFRVKTAASTTSLTAAVDSTTGYWSMVSSPASSAPAAIVLSGVQDTTNWSAGSGPQTFTRVADQNGRPRYSVYTWPAGTFYIEWSGSEWRLIRQTGAVLATNSADEPAPPTSGWSDSNITITYQMSLVFGSQWSQYSPYYYNTGTIQGMPSGVEKTVEVFSCDANGNPSGELEYVSFAPSSQAIVTADASGCTSLQGFNLSSSITPYQSWSGQSSLPSSLASVRAVGVAGSGGNYSQWNPAYPANVSGGVNVAGQTLSAAALNQLYTDLAAGTNNARIFVAGNPGTADDDPTIATAKGYTIFGS